MWESTKNWIGNQWQGFNQWLGFGGEHPAPTTPPAPPTLSAFERYKNELRYELASESALIPDVTLDMLIQFSRAATSADLNRDGAISGAEETRALFKGIMTQDNAMSKMLRMGIDMACQFGDKILSESDRNDLVQLLNNSLSYYSQSGEIEVEKAIAKAINANQDINELSKKLIETMVKSVHETVETDPRAIKIRANPDFTDAKKTELIGMIAASAERITLGVAQKTLALLQESPELRQALLDQPAKVELTPLSWVDLCEAAKTNPQQGCQPAK